MQIVGKRIKQLRDMFGISANELSHRSGVDTAQILKIERNEVSPRIDTLEKIASGLGVEIFVLFDNKERGKLKRGPKDDDNEFIVNLIARLNPDAKRIVLRYIQDVHALFPTADEAQGRVA